eukprot:m.427088 g.427088  ORF g.427088 m.427088 type:complete len:197 (+) comp21361_c0_seq13:535-1125(+)
MQPSDSGGHGSASDTENRTPSHAAESNARESPKTAPGRETTVEDTDTDTPFTNAPNTSGTLNQQVRAHGQDGTAAGSAGTTQDETPSSGPVGTLAAAAAMTDSSPEMAAAIVEQALDPNDINKRPPLSYARLAALAIISLNGRAKVTDIYAWIEENFPYYREGTQYWKVSHRGVFLRSEAWQIVPQLLQQADYHLF